MITVLSYGNFMKNETLIDSKGGKFTGEVKNGQPHGQGAGEAPRD